jgi:hypothetical protein
VDTFSGIVLAHLERYPRMEIQDLYKLAFQAALGAEHAAATLDANNNFLMQELRGLAEGPVEPPVDPISPDGRMLRVHLRPLILSGGNPLKLSQAFWESSRAYHGTEDLLKAFWLEAQNLAETGGIPLDGKEMEQYFADRQAGEFQPVHHSQAYRETYKPAYRVVLREFWLD